MPFRDFNRAFQDIADAIDLIGEFTSGMDASGFREDPRTIAAVERKLLTISEAAIRLGQEAQRLCPGPPWGEIRGIGNWLRHQYDAVELPVLWKTVRDDLPPLKAAVLRSLAQASENSTTSDSSSQKPRRLSIRWD
ncbi:MAG: DUF86 domain-containing protein [Acidobacteria bacterium]|nr:DUF86 domain-containing protein [Acidobacteriota bacterium]